MSHNVILASLLLCSCFLTCLCWGRSAFVGLAESRYMFRQVPQAKSVTCRSFNFVALCSQHRFARRQSSSTIMRLGDASGNRLDFVGSVARTTLLSSGLIAAEVVGQPQATGAFCGKPYPRWAYFVNFDEGVIPFSFEGFSGDLFLRTVGNEKDQDKVRIFQPSGAHLSTTSSCGGVNDGGCRRFQAPCKRVFPLQLYAV